MKPTPTRMPFRIGADKVTVKEKQFMAQATTSVVRPMQIGVKGQDRLRRLLSHLILLFFTVVVGYPVLWMFIASFKSGGELLTNPWGLPMNFAFINYTTAWQAGALGPALRNSIVVAISTVVLVLIIAMLAGY